MQCSNGSGDVLLPLLASTNSDGITPVHFAEMANNTMMLEELIKYHEEA